MIKKLNSLTASVIYDFMIYLVDSKENNFYSKVLK